MVFKIGKIFTNENEGECMQTIMIVERDEEKVIRDAIVQSGKMEYEVVAVEDFLKCTTQFLAINPRSW